MFRHPNGTTLDSGAARLLPGVTVADGCSADGGDSEAKWSLAIIAGLVGLGVINGRPAARCNTHGASRGVVHNESVIVGQLREAAGPDVPIVGMNYWSPLAVDWFANPDSAHTSAARTVGFNDFLELLYAAGGSPVADVESAFAVTDFTTIVDLAGAGPVPLSVYSVCTFTWICTGPPLGPDIHPNTAGHAVIAAAFEDALPF